MIKRSIVFLLFGFSLLHGRNLPALDQTLSSQLQGSNQYPVLDIIMESISLATPMVEFGTVGAQWLDRRPLDARNTVTALGLTNAGVLALKYTFHRKRPDRTYAPRLWNTRITPSFPSGHTASSAAYATVMTTLYPQYKSYWLGFAFFSGYSQIYTGNHYVLDVLAGWSLGYLVGKTVSHFIRHPSSVVSDQNTPPSVSGPRLQIMIPL